MLLKRLSIQGFKSFAERTSLEFEPGITGIVGPNGSGKSNIADALRWILGEQRIKHLRGAKLEDVIFAGSQGCKPLGMAEVTMYLDNSQRKLDLDYAEVTVTRRVFRSGESEFLINNTPCRLRDIQELFMDTGIGRDAYCVLGQSDIDVILSPNSEDRRRFFEEAAGVVKFRVRKQEAQRRLAETETNLTRLDDILHEIRGQLSPLARQAKKAEQYRHYQNQLKSAELIIYAQKYVESQEQLIRFQEEVDKLTIESAGISGQFSTIESQLETKKLILTNLEKELEGLHVEDLETTRRVEQLNSEVRLSEEKRRRYQEDSQRIQEDLALLSQQIQSTQTRLAEREEALVQATMELENWTQKVGQAQNAVEEKANIFALINQETTEVEENINVISEQVVILRAQVAAAISRGEQAQAEMARLNQELSEVEAEITALEQELAGTEGSLHALNNDAESLKVQSEELVESQKSLQISQEQAQQRLEQVKEKYGRVTSDLRALEALAERGEDLYAGVRRVLQAATAQRLSGIIGVVADLLEVPAGFEVAIETALGSNIQCLVAQDDNAAAEAIYWLKQERAGRATFLPLNTITGRSLAPEELTGVKNISGYLGLAADLVKSSPQLEPLKSYLLGRTLLAEELESARKIAAQTRYRYQVVTKDGEIIRPGGSMTGGYQKQNSGGLLARKGQIKELQNQKEELELAVDRCQEELAAWLQRRQEHEAISRELEQKFQKLRITQASTQQELVGLRKNQAMLQKRRDDLKERSLKLGQDYSAQTVEDLKVKLVQAEEKRQTLVAEQTLVKVRLNEAQEKLEETKRSAADVTTAQAVAREKFNRFQSEQQQTEKELNGLIQRETQYRQRIAVAQEGMAHASEVGGDAQLERERLTLRKAELAQIYRDKREQREALQTQIAAEDNQLKVVRRRLAEVTELLHESKLNRAKNQSEKEVLLQRAQEQYGFTEMLLTEVDLSQVDLSSVQTEIDKLSTKLQRLGPINPEAETEYQEVLDRYNFLNSQYADLVKAKEDLDNVIVDIEKSTEEQFANTFTQIQTEFQTIFVRLFGGGNAYLTLTDPEDLTETGVEIMAQPPGKKLQNLALLSSGERSLTAIALLMAILKVNPAPFTVLDEVDAALDDANLERFAALLKEFSIQTQFIIITHRRRTMEAAQVLYGVTMQKSRGYSEVVSVRLSDIE